MMTEEQIETILNNLVKGVFTEKQFNEFANLPDVKSVIEYIESEVITTAAKTEVRNALAMYKASSLVIEVKFDLLLQKLRKSFLSDKKAAEKLDLLVEAFKNPNKHQNMVIEEMKNKNYEASFMALKVQKSLNNKEVAFEIVKILTDEKIKKKGKTTKALELLYDIKNADGTINNNMIRLLTSILKEEYDSEKSLNIAKAARQAFEENLLCEDEILNGKEEYLIYIVNAKGYVKNRLISWYVDEKLSRMYDNSPQNHTAVEILSQMPEQTFKKIEKDIIRENDVYVNPDMIEIIDNYYARQTDPQEKFVDTRQVLIK